MRNSVIIFLIILFSLTVSAQTPKKNNFGKNEKNSSATKVADEKTEFENAVNETDATKRVSALQSFLQKFPNTEQKARVLGLIVSGRAEIAETKLKNYETEEAVKLFKLAVQESPQPVSDDLFARVLMQIPSSLFFRGERQAAYDIAKLIEERIGDDAKQMLGLATFYISVENGSDAIKLLNKSIEKNPDSSVAFQTLGLAHRMNFDLEQSVAAYQKAVELDNEAVPAKGSLAELKRATGKSAEALRLYEDILAKDSSNWNAKTGLILAMFDAGKADEAELEMRNFLVENPNNLPLLVGAAYYFAAQGDGTQAVEYSQKALAIEPRYVWAYITLAKGFLLQGEPLFAERSLLTAKQYGNFPTLQYELAMTRIAAGFYRDAADELKTNFSVKNGLIKTNLGGRFEKEADNFNDLLALERQASIFQPTSASDATQADKLKRLLNFVQTLEAKETDEANLIAAADEFIKGDDKMKTHRQIFVANQLLEKQKALPKVLEITKEAVKGVDAALDAKNSSASVLADELYEPRKLATAKGEVLVVPELSRQTLASILRGRIEEISGWALFRQEKNDEALVRMKRAISVFPKDSAWSRLTHWQTGMILERQGKNEEALDNYIKGYSLEQPDEVKKLVIESLYKRIYGSLDGFQERLEAKPQETNIGSIFTKKTEVQAEPKVEKTPEIQPETPTENKTEETIPENLNLDINLKPLENPTPTPEENVPIVEEKTETVVEENNSETVIKETNSDNSNTEIPVEPKVETDLKVENTNEIETENTNTTDEVKTENTETTDEIKTDSTENTDAVEPKIETEQPKENDNLEQPKTETPKLKPLGKPVLVIEDKLANTKTESTIGDEKTENVETETPNNPTVEESKPNETDENKTVPPIEDNSVLTRPRVIIEDKLGIVSDEVKPCQIVITQEVVSIFSDGGSLDFLVLIEKESRPDEIKAVSKSPENVEVAFQPEISQAQGRAFFIIRSVSQQKGEYKVLFQTPCGNKEISVKVR